MEQGMSLGYPRGEEEEEMCDVAQPVVQPPDRARWQSWDREVPRGGTGWPREAMGERVETVGRKPLQTELETSGYCSCRNLL